MSRSSAVPVFLSEVSPRPVVLLGRGSHGLFVHSQKAARRTKVHLRTIALGNVASCSVSVSAAAGKGVDRRCPPPPFPRRGMRSLFLRPIYCIFAFNFCGLFPTITLIHNTCRTCGEILFASQFCEWVAGSYIVGHLLNNMVLLRLYSLENGDNER